MVVTPSRMLEIGSIASEFSLLEPLTGKKLTLSEMPETKALVVIFMCNHCPYVIHILPKLFQVAKEYQSKGVSFIAINSNDVEAYPQDGPEKMKELSQKMSFPFLWDEDQTVAKKYKAACTPDLYVFDQAKECIYRGRFDESRPDSGQKASGKDLVKALDLALMGETLDESEQFPSVGCNIKWKNA